MSGIPALRSVHIGFTGTQVGMTTRQKELFSNYIKWSPRIIDSFHHGDCIGADAEAHQIVMNCDNVKSIIIHPPKNPTKRAFCHRLEGKVSAYVLDECDYLTRNHHIVHSCALLIACPKNPYEERRSGTWSTVRFAKKHGRLVVVFPP